MPAAKSSVFLWFMAVGLAVLLPFHEVIFDQSATYLFRDLGNTLWASLLYWSDTLRNEGRIPLWSSLFTGGKPFLADPSERALFPLNFILLLFSREEFARGMVWFLLSHYVLLVWGYFFLFLQLRVRPGISAILALVFSWSGYSLSTLNIHHMLAGHAGAVWCMAFWVSFLRTRAALDCWLSALGLSFCFYGGDPQFMYIVPFFLLVLAWQQELA